jgi:hypothetical protein
MWPFSFTSFLDNPMFKCRAPGSPNRGTPTGALCTAKALAAIEVEQRNLMAEVGPARNGSGATAFWVAWMSAYHDNL